MFHIPSRKERKESKLYEGAAQLQTVDISSKSQEVNTLPKDFNYNPAYKFLNPFREGDVIVLEKEKSERYSKVSGLTTTLKGTISKILSEDLVNLSYWETDPPVIKTVPVNHVKLNDTNSFIVKMRYSILKVVRFIRIKLKFTMDF